MRGPEHIGVVRPLFRSGQVHPKSRIWAGEGGRLLSLTGPYLTLSQLVASQSLLSFFSLPPVRRSGSVRNF